MGEGATVGDNGSMARHRAAAPFRLLYVCTGNICRSPFAEIITRHVLIGRLGGREASAFQVSSAGVRAVVGSGMHPDSRAELAPWNLDTTAAEQFTARQLRSAMVAECDLVLGATPRHRSAVVERLPAALPITFSLREFARLAEAVDPAALPEAPTSGLRRSWSWPGRSGASSPHRRTATTSPTRSGGRRRPTTPRPT